MPDDSPWHHDELSVVIVYYYLNETALDVDNLAKPILDAMVGLAYEDDGQISQLTVRKTRLEPLLELHDPRPPLAAALEAGSDFAYVAIGTAPDHTELPK